MRELRGARLSQRETNGRKIWIAEISWDDVPGKETILINNGALGGLQTRATTMMVKELRTARFRERVAVDLLCEHFGWSLDGANQIVLDRLEAEREFERDRQRAV